MEIQRVFYASVFSVFSFLLLIVLACFSFFFFPHRGLNIFHFCIFRIFLLLICFLIKLLLYSESSTSGSFDQAPITF